jgi:hypothetical protein
MNIALENKFEKKSKTLVLFMLVSMLTYGFYNIFAHKAVTYYKPIEKIYTIDPIIKISGDTVYPLTDPVIIN